MDLTDTVTGKPSQDVGDPDTTSEISAAPEAATATAAPCEASHITIEGSLKTAPLDCYIRQLLIRLITDSLTSQSSDSPQTRWALRCGMIAKIASCYTLDPSIHLISVTQLCSGMHVCAQTIRRLLQLFSL
jgi:hypothetical protein